MYFVQSFVFSTPPSDERFIFKSGRIRADVEPVSHTSGTTPAARALERAAAQTLPQVPSRRAGTVAEEANERSASSREKGREARTALGFPLLQ